MIDFSNCPRDGLVYGGSDKKFGVLYNEKHYMIKFSDEIPDEKRNSKNSSYSNSVLSEHICCQIYKTIGIDAQETLLGTYSFVKDGIKKEYPVVACENFIPEGFLLQDFKDIENASLLIDKSGKIPKLRDIYTVMKSYEGIFQYLDGQEALDRYWDCFIVDALLGNFDRHANNWAYLYNPKTQDARFAPVFDCGSCLYPQLSDDAINKVLNNTTEIQMRIDKFPTAALDIGGMKANYKDYISSYENRDCTNALMRIYPRIDMDKISSIIDNIDSSQYPELTKLDTGIRTSLIKISFMRNKTSQHKELDKFNIR